MGGYAFHAAYTDNDAYVIQTSDQPNISGEIMDQQIIDALHTPETAADAQRLPAEVYTFTGYVRSVSAAEITVEDPDDATTWPDALQFQLGASTTAVERRASTDDNGLPISTDTALDLADIAVGDIVTVITAEDITASQTRTVKKIIRYPNDSLTGDSLTNSQ